VTRTSAAGPNLSQSWHNLAIELADAKATQLPEGVRAAAGVRPAVRRDAAERLGEPGERLAALQPRECGAEAAVWAVTEREVRSAIEIGPLAGDPQADVHRTVVAEQLLNGKPSPRGLRRQPRQLVGTSPLAA
jgi:hypothetical protein